jgi:hypothetical protein
MADWADHIDSVMEATRQYVASVVAGLQYVTPTAIEADTGALADAASDLVGNLRKAGNRIQEDA